MSEPKFTPGPWRAVQHEAGWTVDTGGLRGPVRAICYYEDGDPVGAVVMDEADACLIAAAPDLYEASKDLLEFIVEVALRGPHYDETPALRSRLDKARAALAKAATPNPGVSEEPEKPLSD